MIGGADGAATHRRDVGAPARRRDIDRLHRRSARLIERESVRARPRTRDHATSNRRRVLPGGVPLALGREFTVDEDRPGQPIFLRGESYHVVGVAPADFQSLGNAADVYTPVRPARAGEGGGANYQIVVRIRDVRDSAEAGSVAARPHLSECARRVPVLLLVIACVNRGALFLCRSRRPRRGIVHAAGPARAGRHEALKALHVFTTSCCSFRPF